MSNREIWIRLGSQGKKLYMAILPIGENKGAKTFPKNLDRHIFSIVRISIQIFVKFKSLIILLKVF